MPRPLAIATIERPTAELAEVEITQSPAFSVLNSVSSRKAVTGFMPTCAI
jgi:hypothetical protein